MWTLSDHNIVYGAACVPAVAIGVWALPGCTTSTDRAHCERVARSINTELEKKRIVDAGAVEELAKISTHVNLLEQQVEQQQQQLYATCCHRDKLQDTLRRVLDVMREHGLDGEYIYDYASHINETTSDLYMQEVA